MTNPYPPYQQPRKLERSRTNKVLGGVCGGLANYVNMDPTLVRVLTVIISLFTGVPIIVYLIALFVIPEESADSPSGPYPPVNGPQWASGGYPQDPTQTGTVPPNQQWYEPAPGSGQGADSGDAVWGQQGAPWEQPQPVAPQDPEPTSTSETRSTDQGTTPESTDDKRP